MPRQWSEEGPRISARDQEAIVYLEEKIGPPPGEKGCLEVLALLPFMGVMYYVYQIIFNQ